MKVFEMEVLHGALQGDRRVGGPVEISGLVNGTVTVARSGWLILTGTIAGSLIVNRGYAELRGTVQGQVQNLDGVVRIFGTVQGDVTARGGSVTVAEPGAHIQGQHRFEPLGVCATHGRQLICEVERYAITQCPKPNCAKEAWRHLTPGLKCLGCKAPVVANGAWLQVRGTTAFCPECHASAPTPLPDSVAF